MAILGYNTAGSVTSGAVSGDTNFGSRFTATESGTITQISAYVKLTVAGTAPMRVAVFNVGAGNTIGSLVAESTGSANVTSTSFAWVTVPISAAIVGGQGYWIFAWPDTSGISGGGYNYAADVNAINNTIAISWANTFPNWSTTGNGSNEAYDLAYASIYADYTPDGPPQFGIPSVKGVQSFTGIKSITI